MVKQAYKYVVVILVLALVALPACGSPAPITIQVTDQMGRLVGLTEAPTKIVSLDPGVTEVLYALGLSDRVAGVSNDSDFPIEVFDKTRVGDSVIVDWEQMKRISPDLVIISSYSADYILPDLEKRGLTTLALAPANLEEVMEAITLVGEITERQVEAAQLVAELRDRIQAVADKTDAIPENQRPTVFYMAYLSPIITVGSGTIEDELIQRAGGINVAGDMEGYNQIKISDIIDANPQVMISMFQIKIGGENEEYDFLSTDPELEDTDARRDGRVWSVWDVAMSRMGPRLVDGLEELQMLIHLNLSSS